MGSPADRGLPGNWETERALLGGLLLAPERIDHVRASLEPDQFHRPSHGYLFWRMLVLRDGGAMPDLLVVLDDIEARGDQERVGGIAYVSALPQACPSVDLVGQYAQRIRRHAERREAVLRARRVEEVIREGGDPSPVVLAALGVDVVEPWPEPVPLEEGVCRVPFPIDALPSPLGSTLAAVADTFQVPVDLAATLALGLLGGACAPATVRAREGWTEPLVIWTCSVAPPGARKSPVLKLLRAPADEVERELRTDDRRRSELERASLLAELNAKDRRQRADAESRLRELDNPLVFVTSGDATPEVLVDLLARGQVHGLTVASAEGVILQHMAGLYKDGAANLDVYLQAHGGEPVKVHRKHQPLVEIARPLLALALATQPVTVFDARANRQIAGRGILQRILWSVPPDNVGYRDTYPRPLDPSVPEVWRTVYRRANEQARRAPVLDLSEGARALFEAWGEVHERSLRDLDGIFKEWQSKAPGHVLRLAGIWQLCVGGDRVSEDAVAGALDIMAYFGAHARVALVSAGVDPRAALARKIARWLIRFPDVVAFTERQAHAGVKVEGLRADDVRSALSLLDEYGYVRRAPPVVLDTRGPGRPASPTWLVNPRWERAH